MTDQLVIDTLAQVPQATRKQLAFIRTLAESRELDSEMRTALFDRLNQVESGEGSLSLDRASNWITRLLDKQKAETPVTSEPVVPAGRYAANNSLYRVWRGTRNPSIVHVYEVIGTETGERVPAHVEDAVLAEVAKDPGKAAQEFGHRTGSCSKCGKGLNNNLSRKLGIGPVCLKHWFPDEDRKLMVKTARCELRADGIDPTASYDRLPPAGA